MLENPVKIAKTKTGEIVTTLSKGNLQGTLQPMIIDHCVVRKNGKIVWTNKTVLMLVDKDSRILSNAQFRINAKLKAEKFFLSEGWSIVKNSDN